VGVGGFDADGWIGARTGLGASLQRAAIGQQSAQPGSRLQRLPTSYVSVPDRDTMPILPAVWM
jgi:hypothetical protein